MKNIIAVNSNTYHGFSIDETLEGIAAAGFRYLELAAVRGWTEHIMPDLADEELDRIQKKMSDLGLECIAVSGHCNLTDADRLNDFRDNMELAHRFGAKYINSSTGEAHFGEDEAFTDDVLIKNIKTLLPDLEKYDLVLGLEVHGEYGTGESLVDLVKGVNSPRVGINYDTGNVVYWGGGSLMDDIKKCVDDVVFVHLKDKVGMDNSWNFPAIGQGELDLLGFIEYVEEKGYKAPYSLEIEHNEAFTMRDKVEGDIDFVNKVMKESFEYLKEHKLI
ncbi:MAG: sugar phosphate isomerase/epimerase [Clostridiaceae bacterium]|nr:sugar phosphate isomerase/epimerase [Clostridiaceae bacterium]